MLSAYDFLGIHSGANLEEIEDAYNKRCEELKCLFSNNMIDQDELNKRMILLTEAFNKIKNGDGEEDFVADSSHFRHNDNDKKNDRSDYFANSYINNNRQASECFLNKMTCSDILCAYSLFSCCDCCCDCC